MSIKKTSMAIGVFEEPLELIVALKELLLLGFSTQEFCVSGGLEIMEKTADLISEQSAPDPGLLALFIKTQAYALLDSYQAIVGSQGYLLKAWHQSLEPASQLCLGITDVDYTRTWLQLIEKIKQGCLILMVQTNRAHQLSRASMVLLRRSADNVQTLEMRPTMLAAEIRGEG